MAEIFQSKYTSEEMEEMFDQVKENKPITGENLALALTENNTKMKEYISQQTNKINQISYAQKTVNTTLDSCYCTIGGTYTPVAGAYVPFNKTSGTLNVKDGRVTIKPGQRVQIIISLNYQDTNSKYSNIQYHVKDYTNNKNIVMLQPFTNAQYEYNYVANCQYTNETDKDCEIGLYVNAVYTSDSLNGLSTMTVIEIGRQVVIDPVEYINTTQGIEDTPVGHIISHMGTTAPKHYLICDGTEYNITDYPYLAQHIEDNFGTVNFFGGDGTNTFAVPDLRGEFLRGTGTATRDTGSGADVGEHQDPTEELNSYVSNHGKTLYTSVADTGTYMVKNPDLERTGNIGLNYSNGDYTTNQSYKDITGYYTTRPTNTAVLYCIKYEPTYFMNVIKTPSQEEIDLIKEQNALLKKEIVQLTEILKEISREEGDIL
jgi:microcystin-dependent protein